MGFKAYGLGNVGFKPQSPKLRAYGLGMWALEVLASDSYLLHEALRFPLAANITQPEPSVEGIGIGS